MQPKMQKQRKKMQKERKKKEREEEEEEMEISSSRPRSRGEPRSHRDPGRCATVSGFFFFLSFFSDEHVGVALVVFFFCFLFKCTSSLRNSIFI